MPRKSKPKETIYVFENIDDRNKKLNSGFFDGKHIVAQGGNNNTDIVVKVLE